MTKTQDSITKAHAHPPKNDCPNAYAFKNWGTLFENAQGEVLEIRGLPQEAPDFHVKWTRTTNS